MQEVSTRRSLSTVYSTLLTKTFGSKPPAFDISSLNEYIAKRDQSFALSEVRYLGGSGTKDQ